MLNKHLRCTVSILIITVVLSVCAVRQADAEEMTTRRLLGLGTGPFWDKVSITSYAGFFDVYFGWQSYTIEGEYTLERIQNNGYLRMQVYACNNPEGKKGKYICQDTVPLKGKHLGNSGISIRIQNSSLPFNGKNYIFGVITVIINGKELQPAAKSIGLKYK